MRRHHVTPIPRHFELWFGYASGELPQLTRRIDAIVANGEAFTPDVLAGLHREYIAKTRTDADAIDSAQLVQEIAATLATQVQSNQQGVVSYGQTLAHWAGNLHQSSTTQGLQPAIKELIAETQQAHARNAMLEQQIASSVARVGELQERLVKAETVATTDPLTGIPNRAAFDGALKGAVSQARGGGGGMALLLVDIDHFKRFNDRFGHLVGDLVLRLVARVLASNVKGRDTAARYGGEEFAVVLTDAGLDAGAIVGEQIRQALSGLQLTHHSFKEPVGSITVSIGVAVYHEGDTGEKLLERADRALYQAKHSGRNLVCTEAMFPLETLVTAD